MSTIKDELARLAQNAVRLTIEGKAPGTPGCTRFGGAPDVPGDFVWPVFESGTYDDDEVKPRPLAFLAQFDCAQLAPLDTDGLLPRTGVLSFFYELDSQRWGFDPEDRGCARVFWFENAEDLSPAPFPKTLDRDFRLPAIGISMTTETSYPDYEEFEQSLKPEGDVFNAYLAAQAELGIEDAGNRSQLLGWPDTIQGSMAAACELTSQGYYLGGDKNPPPPQALQEARNTAVEDWQLLFQLDTVERGSFELMFGDCGRLYFYIRKEDLMARRFDNVWLVLQCG